MNKIPLQEAPEPIPAATGSQPVNSRTGRQPWFWIPSLYFLSGLPYFIVVVISVTMYENLGIPKEENAFFTSLIYLPWVIKPIWSPFIDIIRTKRWWSITMQWVIGVAFAIGAFLLNTSLFFEGTLIIFWLIAFASATNDIASDGFYLISLDEHQQSYFVGIRQTFYRLAKVFSNGVVLYIAGTFIMITGNSHTAWTIAFVMLAAIFIIGSIYNSFAMPRPENGGAVTSRSSSEIFKEFWLTVVTFFKKKHAGTAVAFILLFRLPEAFLEKMLNLFLLDPVAKGGLGLTDQDVALTYGVFGVCGLTIGGILGGLIVSRYGLKKMMRPMALCIPATCAIFLLLSQFSEPSVVIIDICIFVEQFFYGFGITAFFLYLIYFSEGEFATSHYALCTGFMAAGMMLPGMAAGWIVTKIGYEGLFIFATICCVATLFVSSIVKIEPKFGQKQ